MPLSHDQATKLFNHLRAVEDYNEQIAEIQEERNERFALAKEEGFDRKVIEWIIKRRKAGDAATLRFDELTTEYEEAIREQKRLELPEGTRVTISSGDRSTTIN